MPLFVVGTPTINTRAYRASRSARSHFGSPAVDGGAAAAAFFGWLPAAFVVGLAVAAVVAFILLTFRFVAR